jgi:L-iditol 2-dehydrogenase
VPLCPGREAFKDRLTRSAYAERCESKKEAVAFGRRFFSLVVSPRRRRPGSRPRQDRALSGGPIVCSNPGMMRQSVLLEPGRVELREVPKPDPQPGELIVRVELAMTCGTDLKTFRRGHPMFPCPTPLGHEFTGRVSAVGAGQARFSEGDAVFVAPSGPCRACDPCARGLENLCDNIRVGTIALGAFADYVRVPAPVAQHNVFKRPQGLDLRHAALLEPLSCVVAGVERLDLSRRDTVLVLGAGPIGLLFVALLKRRGIPRVVVLGKHAERLAAARSLGADEVLDAGALDDIDAAVAEAIPGGACSVVECVGRPDTWSQAMRWARKGGEVLFFGGCASGAEVPMDTRRIHYDALTLKGAFHFTPSDVRVALDLIASRALSLELLVSGELPLGRLQEAFERLQAGRAIKLAIIPEECP